MGVLDLEMTEENMTAFRCHKHIHKSGGKTGSQLTAFWIHILLIQGGKLNWLNSDVLHLKAQEQSGSPEQPLSAPLHKTHALQVVQWGRFRRKDVTSASLSWRLEAELPGQNVGDAIPRQEAPITCPGATPAATIFTCPQCTRTMCVFTWMKAVHLKILHSEIIECLFL